MQKRLLNHLWKKHNRLTIIKILWTVKGKRKCITRCDCWNTQEQYLFQITWWDVKSCWCLMRETSSKMRRKTWMAIEKHRLYKIWEWMKSRCNNKNNKSYKNYWLRWIKILRNTFEDFKNDMYHSYLEHITKYWENQTTIDRIDNNGDYCKNNCRRATYQEQNNNTRRNITLEYDWKIWTLSNICREFWLKSYSIYDKIKRWTEKNYWFTLVNNKYD